MAKALESILLVVIPISNATITSASAYYVFTLVDLPQAGLAAALIFVMALYVQWGNTEYKSIA